MQPKESGQSTIGIRELMGRSQALERIIATLEANNWPFTKVDIMDKTLILGVGADEMGAPFVFSWPAIKAVKKLRLIGDFQPVPPEGQLLSADSLIVKSTGKRPNFDCRLKDDLDCQAELSRNLKSIGGRLGVKEVKGAKKVMTDLKDYLHQGLNFYVDFVDPTGPGTYTSHSVPREL